MRITARTSVHLRRCSKKSHLKRVPFAPGLIGTVSALCGFIAALLDRNAHSLAVRTAELGVVAGAERVQCVVVRITWTELQRFIVLLVQVVAIGRRCGSGGRIQVPVFVVRTACATSEMCNPVDIRVCVCVFV